MANIPRYTYSDYKNWSEDWELINGYPYSMLPSNTMTHQMVAGNIYMQLELCIANTNNKNLMVIHSTDWLVDNSNVVRPDLMIIYNINKEQDYPTATPRLIVEVLSPSTRNKDRNEKFQLYESNGVPYYIIIDADNNAIEIFELMDNIYKTNNAIAAFVLTPNCTIQNNVSL
jgi:Uma2 family endonuclease